MSFTAELAPLRINWKSGTPGNPYVNTDTATAAPGEVVMVDVANPGVAEIVIVNMPSAGPASAGQRIIIQNMNDNKVNSYGQITISPASGDAIGTRAVDTDVTLNNASVPMIELVSDGNGVWWPQVENADPVLNA